MGDGSRRAAGELEKATMAALWAAEGPLTPADVRAALGGTLAYNTVHTILTRLSDKGLVRRHARGRHATYLPAKDAAELAADQMRGALEAAGDRAQVLRRFVTSLSPADEDVLRAALGGAAGDG
jgi:predicted transcriptional regulator